MAGTGWAGASGTGLARRVAVVTGATGTELGGVYVVAAARVSTGMLVGGVGIASTGTLVGGAGMCRYEQS